MFTVKFIKVSEESTYEKFVSAEQFDKDLRDGFAFVIANGVEYQIGGEKFSTEGKTLWDSCFIESETGKTIDRIGPFAHRAQ